METDTGVLTETEEVTQEEEPTLAHIIDRGSDERPAGAIVLEAIVNGTELTALCGHKFIPSRDPTLRPKCPKCEEIFEFVADFRGV